MIAPAYRDRVDAGRALAGLLERDYSGRRDLLVLALPRGGVPVAAEIATVLGAPLDVLVVRKLGVPGHPELAMGAIASGGTLVLTDVPARLGIAPEAVAGVVAHERRELDRRERALRGERPSPDVTGRTVILVDDGLATGATMHAAVEALRRQGAEAIVVAVPVGPPEACAWLAREVTRVVCPKMPEAFYAVGEAYEDFTQVEDDEVRAILEQSRERGLRPRALR